MFLLKRLRILPAVLGAAAALVALGTSLFGIGRDPVKPLGGPAAAPALPTVDEMATRFSKLPVLAFQPKPGETIFAWQVKPELNAAPARPRDVVVLVDTSASQAGKPMMQAKHIVTALAAAANPDDRFALWTVSTPSATKPLTAGLQAGNSEDLRVAAANLSEVEYGAGSTDLKGGLSKALAVLPPNPGRQQIVLFLGDGESAYEPVTEADRLAIGGRMDLNDVYFFAVPLGVKMNPYNLHGLAALTGGSVIRLQEDLNNPAQRTEFTNRLAAAFAVPVFKADKFRFGEEVAEVYPSKLPPLRGDKATLVLGRLGKPAANVTLTVNGTVARAPVTLNLSQPVPATQADHFFLNLMLDQWRSAPNKEAPSVLQADRALALASTQVKLYRNEYLTQAVWAVTSNNFDEAAKMYQAALKIDPTDGEADAGVKLVAKLKAGTITRADIQKKIDASGGALKPGADKTQVVRQAIQDTANQPDPKAQPVAGQPQPGTGAQPPVAADLLREAAARRRIEEEKYRVIVDQTIRRGRQLLRANPDAAYEDLKRQRDDILGYEGIGDAVRTQMVADLEAVMREVYVKGAQIKREAATEREQIARTRQRLNEFDRQQNLEDLTKARIDAFRQLMHQARFELAYQEAQLMIQERVARGLTVPDESVASYIIGQQATQLREWRELVRIRDDRFLLAMMQTEKSHIPYPDEPPVHFPPAAVWRELTGTRVERYGNMSLGSEPSQTQKRIQTALERDRVSYEKSLDEQTSLLELVTDMQSRFKVPILIMEEDFRKEGVMNVKELKPKMANKIDGMPLGVFLDVVLRTVPAATGVTYIVRPDFIEITTYTKRLDEKVTRVFPVADLAIPIPNAVVQSQLIQNLSIQNSTLAIFGAASLYGGGLSGFLGGNGQQQGQQGNPFGGPMGGGNSPFFGNQNQGGIVGLGGNGNVGQFGNLGGQFGLQGTDQSGLLMQLILDTVAKDEWDRFNQATTVGPMNMGMPMDERESFLPIPKRNSLGYYPPARALIVRGTGRYHNYGSLKLEVGAAGGQAAIPRQNNGFAANPAGNNNANPANPNPGNAGNANVNNRPAFPNGPIAVGPDNKPQLLDPKTDPELLAKKLDKDPRRMWQQAVDWTVTDPGLIVASAEFLIEMKEPAHAVEVLKAGLRKGLTTDEWAHEALAVSLQMTQANPAEAERAALSGIDLDTGNAQAYIRAAKVEADLKNHDYAFALCQRAAVLTPDRPEVYANALVYAESAKEVKSDAVAWAADNLLKRDWSTADGIDYHQKAREHVDTMVKKFDIAGIKADALKRTQIEQTRRDLVVELLWQGTADLDLFVTEPSGATCSATQKRTTGGGVLKADHFDPKNDGDSSEMYVAASAFSGTYKVGVKQAFGRAVGGTATVKVTKFKGTPNETHDLVTVDLMNPKPVEVKLDGGTRTELATVSDDPSEFLRAETTAAPVSTQASGFGGGVGPAGKTLTSVVEEANGPRLPVVVKGREQVLPGLGGAADIRATYKMNPDRKTYSVTVNQVFATSKGEVAMPKLQLLPGGEGATR